MATMEEHDLVLHNIKAKLYPNHLEHVEGNYNARVDNERTLTSMEVCTAAKTRGGYPGDINEMYDAVKWYHSEQMYQICDGYAVSNDYYTLYPHISGHFESPHDTVDHEKHKVSVRFSARKQLRDIQKKTTIEIIGVADTNGFIDYLIDHEEHDARHNSYVPGNMIAIYGSKIKITGDDPANGVYFVPIDDPSQAVKMTRLGENNPKKITGIAPDTQHAYNRIEIRTQFNGSNNSFLKEPRIIVSLFTTEAL
ncbi:MAG: DUF4469 domain-containing protein [Oscillospiraceae bacterium]|nr:DUF4469 domain-containing protein [Oscillospiraceae bacterium]